MVRTNHRLLFIISGPACGPDFIKSAKISGLVSKVQKYPLLFSGQVRTDQDVELPIAESDGIVEE